MASPDLKQRHKDHPTTDTTPPGGVDTTTDTTAPRGKKLAMAKRGLRSLSVAIAVPLSLAMLTACISGGASASGAEIRPFWFLPAWAIHVASAFTSCLMGLAAWLVWAEGGFHREPAALPLYLAQLILALLWGPLMFRVGATRVGLTVALGLITTLFGCSQLFRRVSPIAADLVKPCLAWVAFLVLFNYKLL